MRVVVYMRAIVCHAHVSVLQFGLAYRKSKLCIENEHELESLGQYGTHEVIFEVGTVADQLVYKRNIVVEVKPQAKQLGVQVGWHIKAVNGVSMPANEDAIKAAIDGAVAAKAAVTVVFDELEPGLLLVDFGGSELGLSHRGNTVTAVSSGGPADKQGVKVGWHMKTINGVDVDSQHPVTAHHKIEKVVGKKMPTAVIFDTRSREQYAATRGSKL